MLILYHRIKQGVPNVYIFKISQQRGKRFLKAHTC